MPCRVGTAKADLTDRQRDRWGDAEIKSSTRISEASDTLAWALWFSEGVSCLAVTHRVDTHSCQRGSNKSAQRPAPPAQKKEKIYHLWDAVRRHAVKLLICDVSYQLNVFLVPGRLDVWPKDCLFHSTLHNLETHCTQLNSIQMVL